MKFYPVVNNDLIIGYTTNPDIKITLPHLELLYLRYNSQTKQIIDIRELPQPYTFYIDEKGIKHIVQLDESWQPLKCNWYDELVNENGIWRVKTEEEKLEEYKQEKLKELDSKAKNYITDILSQLDWGNTYEECIAELKDTEDLNEKLVYAILINYTDTLTINDIIKNAIYYLTGKTTSDEILNRLKELSLSEEDYNKVINLLKEGITATRLRLWKEDVWRYVEEISAQIKNSTSIKQIDEIMNNIQFPEPPRV